MKKKIVIFLLLLVITIIFLLPISMKGFTFWMDNLGLLDSKEAVIKYLYGWKLDLLGIVNFTSYVSTNHYILSYIFLNIFGYQYGYYFMYFFIVFVTVFLGFKITNIYIKNVYHSFFISIIFIFNLPFLRFFYGQGTITFLISVIGFLTSIYILLKYDINNYKYIFLLILSSFLISHPFLFFFYCLIFGTLLLFHYKIGFKKIIFYGLGVLLLNFYWINQFVIGTIVNQVGLGQKDYSDSLVNVFSSNSQLFNSFLFIGKNADYINDFFGIFSLLILLAYILLWGLFLKITISKKLKGISIVLLLILLFLLLFSVGNREPLGILYGYLYNNISFFNFFRTFTNVLLFGFYIFILFIILNLDKKNYKYLFISNLIFLFAFISSNYYYSYNKTVNVPDEYFEVKNIIEANSIGNNVIILPCSTYDYYKWDTGNQDKYFLESYLDKNGVLFYRPTLSNYSVIKDLFYNICSYNFNYKDLNKYGVDYVILRKDLQYLEKNYYLHFDKNKLNNLEKVYTGKYVNLYKSKTKFINEFDYINPVIYNLKLNNLITKKVINNNNFNTHWKLYLKDKQGLLAKPLFEDNHHLVYDYANGWTISKDEIIKYVNDNYLKELKKEGYPKTLDNGKIDYKYYTLNPDGSIDLELTLYFKPQSYFYLGIIISGTTFVLLISYLGVDAIRNRRKNKL